MQNIDARYRVAAYLRLSQEDGDKDVSEVKPVIGLEQEYFLVDKDKFLKTNNDFLLQNQFQLGLNHTA